MITTENAFILLDDARAAGGAPARLYRDPVRTVSAMVPEEIPALLDQLRTAQRDGYHIAGYLGYEAGFALDDGTGLSSGDAGTPLGWFGIFNEYQIVDNDVTASCLRDPAGAWIGKIRPDISRADYHHAFSMVQDFIRAGDIYQANLTFRATASFVGHPLALYAALRPAAAAPYGGVIWTGDQWLLSFSPELFFAVKDGRVTTKPMKGTAPRAADPADDANNICHLRDDPKQRAENLMIVDLLRNDLSRICDPGSVRVPDLFHVETYPTVHQMTSTVTGHLRDGADSIDLLRAIFPCGSITGAPKIRAMQIIDLVEQSPRGVYCGAIGRIDPCGDAAFNVAIRTFSLAGGDVGTHETEKYLCPGVNMASLGLGSGIVADSDEESEWAECLAKGGFAKMPGYGFDLIETMRFEPDQGILRLELHLERMKDSARALEFEFDRHAARNQLHAATFHMDHAAKLRLLLSRTGAIAISAEPAPAEPGEPWRVAILPLPVDVHDYRLRHKTSDRGFYDDARKLAGNVEEILFERPDGFLTEGSFTSLYVERDGKLVTPPLHHGLLPSILRRDLLEQGRAEEGDLRIADLADGFFVGNALRGLIPARLVAKPVA